MPTLAGNSGLGANRRESQAARISIIRKKVVALNQQKKQAAKREKELKQMLSQYEEVYRNS